MHSAAMGRVCVAARLALLLAAACTATTALGGTACTFNTTINTGGGVVRCAEYGLGALPAGVFQLADKFGDQYLVARPCGLLNATALCKAGRGGDADGVALQVSQVDGSCYSLGGLGATAVGSAAGLTLTFAGGVGGRSAVIDFVCNASAPAGHGPEAEVVENPRLTYRITWHTPAVCAPPSEPGQCKSSHVVPKPSEAQRSWMALEMGAIGHFNMGTYSSCGIGVTDGSGGNGIAMPPASTFNPTNVDTEQWVKALVSAGVQRAVLVISHGCGFNTFPSRTAFPEFGFEYHYSVRASPWKGGKGDVAAEFVASCRKHGIRPGFYLGTMNNAFLNVVRGKVVGNASSTQANITQDQYTQILMAQLTQAWTDYGELAEVWFDGGYPPGTEQLITDLLAKLQPNAVAFQGPGRNVIRWVGTEAGDAAYPQWSTQVASPIPKPGAGTPNGTEFVPSESDTCLQTTCPKARAGSDVGAPYAGCWFYNEKLCPKSQSELIATYHNTLGRNSFLLLDWTPTKEGVLRQDHLDAYQALGDYLRQCYSTPVAEAPMAVRHNVTINVPAEFDRVVLREDLSFGQLVLAFDVYVDSDTVFSGQSIGNRQIVLLPDRSPAARLRVVVTSSWDTPHFSVAAFNCTTLPPVPQDCHTQAGRRFEGPVITTIAKASVSQCCEACRINTACSVFNSAPGGGNCTLLSAQSGQVAAPGFSCGTPSE